MVPARRADARRRRLAGGDARARGPYRLAGSMPTTLSPACGLPIAASFEGAARHLEIRNFVYLPLEAFAPRLAELFALRAILGLRSPVHTLARLINPFAAAASIQSVFHPGYLAIHRDAALELGQARMTVFRGDGGEAERRPNKPCETLTVADGAVSRRAGRRCSPTRAPRPMKTSTSAAWRRCGATRPRRIRDRRGRRHAGDRLGDARRRTPIPPPPKRGRQLYGGRAIAAASPRRLERMRRATRS